MANCNQIPSVTFTNFYMAWCYESLDTMNLLRASVDFVIARLYCRMVYARPTHGLHKRKDLVIMFYRLKPNQERKCIGIQLLYMLTVTCCARTRSRAGR